MNRVVRRGATPVLLALVATGLAAAPAGAAPTWVAPAVTLAEGTSARPPADSHVVVDAAGNATVAWVDQDGTLRRRRTTCRSRPTRSAARGRRPWTSPAAGDIVDEIDIATNADGFTVAVVDPEHGRHRRARGRDPGAGRSLVGAGPRGRQHRRRRDSPGGRGRGRQRAAHVEGEGPGRLPAVRHQAGGRAVVGSRRRDGPGRRHRQQRVRRSSSPRAARRPWRGSTTSRCRRTAGSSRLPPGRPVEPSAIPRPSRRPPRTPGPPWSR